MFGLGLQELILILVVALVIIGPKKLPDLARSLGKALREFRSATDDIKQSFTIDPIELEQKSRIKKIHSQTPEIKKDSENNKNSLDKESGQ